MGRMQKRGLKRNECMGLEEGFGTSGITRLENDKKAARWEKTRGKVINYVARARNIILL